MKEISLLSFVSWLHGNFLISGYVSIIFILVFLNWRRVLFELYCLFLVIFIIMYSI